MEKQKICIIGGSLTGLMTALSLSRLDCEIDLVTGSLNEKLKSNRSVAISQDNYYFLQSLNIFKSANNNFWPCSKIKLYTEITDQKFSETLEFNNYIKEPKQVFYMIENSKFIKNLMDKIKKIKSISVIKNEMIYEIAKSRSLKSVKFNNFKSKYNLVIVCAGNNSNLVKNLFPKVLLEHSYNETSISTILTHLPTENNTARQIFLDNEILALLPIADNKTSIVWSVKKNIYQKKDSIIKKKIKTYTKNFYKKIKFMHDVEYIDLKFLIRSKYYEDRILLFGDALHTVHPFCGQGFNMTLRDLLSLEEILKEKLNLGLDIGRIDILSEFSKEIKPRNFVHSVGIDFMKSFFSFKGKSLNKSRYNILKLLNNSHFIKDRFFNIADKGFKF